MMNLKIIVAHPNKHHIFEFVVALGQSGFDVALYMPLYYKGFIRAIGKFMPYPLRVRLESYRHPKIIDSIVNSPIRIQLKKIICMIRGISYEEEFDAWMSKRIASGAVMGGVLVTLQDYMPLTVIAAKQRGWLIWSDQIIDNSSAAQQRLMKMYELVGAAPSLKSEMINNAVLSEADVVTFPAEYMRADLVQAARKAKLFCVPYGVESRALKGNGKFDDVHQSKVYRVIARSNSVRKGSPILIKALSKIDNSQVIDAGYDSLEVFILGVLDEETRKILSEVVCGGCIDIKSGAIPHVKIFDFYRQYDLFVMPSVSESLSLATLEAMSSGLPVVVTRYCGVDESDVKQFGCFIEPNEDALYKAIIQMMNTNRDQIANLSKRASHISLNKFSWASYRQGVVGVASNLLAVQK